MTIAPISKAIIKHVQVRNVSFTGRDGDLVSDMYYQLGNVHQATEDVEILSKIERQIKRIKRNNLFAGIFCWKREYYKLKNRRRMKMIEKLLRYR